MRKSDRSTEGLTANRIPTNDLGVRVPCYRCSFSVLPIAGDDLLLPGLAALGFLSIHHTAYKALEGLLRPFRDL